MEEVTICFENNNILDDDFFCKKVQKPKLQLITIKAHFVVRSEEKLMQSKNVTIITITNTNHNFENLCELTMTKNFLKYCGACEALPEILIYFKNRNYFSRIFATNFLNTNFKKGS